jgi:hypothetical protein
MGTGFGFTSITAMQSARAFAAAVAWLDGTKVLVTGGASSNGPLSAELYDDSTQSWTPSEMTTARSHHTATLLKSGQVLALLWHFLLKPPPVAYPFSAVWAAMRRWPGEEGENGLTYGG